MFRFDPIDVVVLFALSLAVSGVFWTAMPVLGTARPAAIAATTVLGTVAFCLDLASAPVVRSGW